MSANIYHVLYTPPSLEKDNTYIEVEALAKRLVESGRFRVDIDYNTLNFVRFSLPKEQIDFIFSERELYKPELLIQTKRNIHSALLKQYPSRTLRTEKVEAEILRLRSDLKKYQPVLPEIEMTLARIVVQSTHPVVMMLLLWEKVEVFVSYSHNIGDLLHMSSWQSQQYNSGMQSTDGRNAAVYISAGGDPLAKTEKNATYGNGLPALARMMIIGAQELGHYSDIMRNNTGQQISRHSANFGGTKAKENVLQARRADIVSLQKFEETLQRLGINNLYEVEREEKFYNKVKRKGMIVWLTKQKIRHLRKKFLSSCYQKHIVFPSDILSTEQYIATYLKMVIADMKFNLEPKADAYARQDPVEEEAIACIEALARVPQQVIKWGEAITRTMMPNLYGIYYNQVIPACITAYENIFSRKYSFTFTKPPTRAFATLQKFMHKLLFSRKRKL